MSLNDRVSALERSQAGDRLSPPVLIVWTCRETEAQARARYATRYGHPPPAGTPVITVVLCEIGN